MLFSHTDYELTGTPCPNCGYGQTRWRYCSNFCNNGYIDDPDETDVLFRKVPPMPCPECRGTSIEVWCPCCMTNISGMELPEDCYDTYEKA